MNSVLLIIICTALFFILSMVICKKSKFNITPDKTLIFYANWCGHCKDAMPEFTKATQVNNKIQMIESNAPGSKELMQKYKVNAFPTIMKASGKKFEGSNTSEELNKFANS